MSAQSEKAKSTIVIKRIKKAGHGGHGAAWKIAYADFVTAMMAFFLLMWLLGSTTQGDLKGIADYFNSPLKVAMAGGSGAGNSNSILTGGGRDLSTAAGHVRNGSNPRDPSVKEARRALQRAERERMTALKGKVEEAIQANGKLADYRKQIRVEMTPDGLRIQILDAQNRPMFDLGSAALQPYMREILKEVAKTLNGVDAKVALTGHTDAAPYAGGERGYSNWELSADRANASRRELLAGGLEAGKIVRVVGLADSSLLLKDEPRNAMNRRISIIVLNKLAAEKLERAGGEIETGSLEEIEEAIQGALPPAEGETTPAEAPAAAPVAPALPAGAAGPAATGAAAPAPAPAAAPAAAVASPAAARPS